MFRATFSISMLLVGISAAGVQPPAEQKLPAEVQKAKEVVAAHLAKIKGSNGTILHISDESLAKTFPKHTFFAVRYRMFPVAEQRPEDMAASNVFAVHDGKLLHLKDSKTLEKFFKENAEDIKKSAWNAARSYLWLAQEFVQDGFFKFEILEKEFGTTGSSGGAFSTQSGRAVVMQGGNGDIKISVIFADGKITGVNETTKVTPGPRPICQATKLLDPDPVVRKMAEQDLLFMGLAARDYMMEQRDQAAPDLRAAIDLLWNKILQNGW